MGASDGASSSPVFERTTRTMTRGQTSSFTSRAIFIHFGYTKANHARRFLITGNSDRFDRYVENVRSPRTEYEPDIGFRHQHRTDKRRPFSR